MLKYVTWGIRATAGEAREEFKKSLRKLWHLKNTQGKRQERPAKDKCDISYIIDMADGGEVKRLIGRLPKDKGDISGEEGKGEVKKPRR